MIDYMKIRIRFMPLKHYDRKNIGWWIWYFRKLHYVKGFSLRILGVYITVSEKNAVEKLIKIAGGRSENLRNQTLPN
jgi:hypothetical protein